MGCFGHHATVAVLDVYEETGICLDRINLSVQGGDVEGDTETFYGTSKSRWRPSGIATESEGRYIGGEMTLSFDTLGGRCAQAMSRAARRSLVEQEK